MLQGRFADTRKALGQLGIEVSEEQVRQSAEQMAAAETKERKQHKSQWTPGVKRALMVVCVFFIFQQITGINIPFYYGPQLLTGLFQGTTAGALAAAIAGLQAAAILGAVNVVATYFGFRWIDKFGRRPLALWGYAGMAVFMVIAALGVATLTGTPKIAVVMVGFSFFITSFAIGVGGTGWLIQGEVFPTNVRGRAAAIAASVDWLANFVIIEIFPALQKAIGLAWVMVLFAGLRGSGHRVRRPVPARNQGAVGGRGRHCLRGTGCRRQSRLAEAGWPVTGSSPRAYDPYPFYEPVGGVVLSGWTTLADHAARTRLLAVDGPEIAPWNELVSQLRRELGERGIAVHALDAREGMASWEAIVASTSSTELADDPDFETLAVASLEDLFRRPVQAEK